MLEKAILIVFAIIGASFLYGLVTPTPIAEPVQAQEELIDAGRFVVEQGGKQLLEESYTLFFTAEEGYMLVSQTRTPALEDGVMLAQQYQLDPGFTPITYHVAVDASSGLQIVSAQWSNLLVHMELLTGEGARSANVLRTSNEIILDNNLISQYVLLILAMKAGEIERDFTAIVPQALSSFASHMEEPSIIKFTSGDIQYEGGLYRLHIGDLLVLIVIHDGRLAVLEIPRQRIHAYNSSLFPEGISLGLEGIADAIPSGMEEQEVTFNSSGITLAGTLTVPAGASKPVPAVLFVHASGPVDRDGNVVGVETDIFRDLAQSLSQAGIASLRYDKRGTGESEGVSSDSSMNDLLADVRIGLSALQACDKIDRQSCFLIGHSEGGILAAIIASERDDLAGIVIIGGAARSLDVIIREQVERLNRGSGMSEEQLQIALEQEDQYLSFVRLSTGEWSSYSFGQLKEAMPWLTEEKYDEVTALSLLWLREHFQHDPLATIRQVSCPVLIIQGEKDLQISAREGKLLAAGLAGGGNSDVTLNIFPDLNHLLRYHPEEPNLLNRHLDLPIDLRVTTAISTWLLDHNVPR